MAGQGTPATALLIRRRIPHTVHPYDPPTGAATYGAGVKYGLEAATALGLPPQRVFKTLVTEVDGRLVVAVVPVAGELDLKALAAAVGGKRATLAEPATAERVTGYVRGGISPLGQRKRLPTVIDSSVEDFPTVFVSAGRRGLQLELAVPDLIRLTAAIVVPIAAVH
ncbi:MAG TPA: Cys-tRNA(Pro) deacylase [Micromonosporaceae bacterium]